MNPELRIPTAKRPGELIVVVEFTRAQLEDLVHLYGSDDAFTEDVRNMMREIDRRPEEI